MKIICNKKISYFKDQQSTREIFGNTKLFEILQDEKMMKEIVASGNNGNEGVSFSVASLRADTLDEQMTQALAASGQRTMTVAPEAGSKRMRESINKGITEEHVYNAMELAAAAGMKNIKLYYMIGLPGEEDVDIEEMVAMIKRIRTKMDEAGNKGELVISVNGFVPKPFTPFQWEAQDTIEALRDKQEHLKTKITDRKIRYTHHDARVSHIEAVFALGDRRLSKALELARRADFAFDAWDECFDFDKWMEIFAEAGIDTAFYANRQKSTDEVLPWDVIDVGVTKEFLIREKNRAYAEKTTPNCREKCMACGAGCKND